jgi:hypothetical protein
MGACLSSPSPPDTESGNAQPSALEPDETLPASEEEVLRNWRKNDASLATHWAEGENPRYWRGVDVTDGHVTRLFLMKLGISSIPSDISRLSKLEELVLCENSLSGPLPPALGSIAGLRLLNLGANRFCGGLPKEWEKLTKLEDLDLSGSPLEMPEGLPANLLAKLTSMEDLKFSGAKIAKVPPDVRAMKRLFTLEMCDCGVETIDAAIGECEELVVVNFSENLLETVPRELCDLRKLEVLDFSDNPNLKTVSEDFDELEFKVEGHLRVAFDDHVEFV